MVSGPTLPVLTAWLLAAPSADLIAQWIRNLDHDRFAVREAAQAQLRQVGTAALAPLAQAAVCDSPELMARCVRLIETCYKSKDPATSKAARAVLVELSERDHPVSDLARDVLLTEQTRAIAKLETNGVEVKVENDTVVEVIFDNAMLINKHVPLLKSFPDLEVVSLKNKRVNDTTLGLLGQLPKVHKLDLFQSNVGDKGLVHLKQLPALTSLHLGKTKVTDAGLEQLGQLKKLEHLGLRGSAVTDAGLKHLTNLPELSGLNLGETKITRAGLVHLAKLPKLSQLWVFKTKLGDDSVSALGALENLDRLEIWGSQITLEGLGKLEAALPRTNIRNQEGDD
jgi:hypothetical protein